MGHLSSVAQMTQLVSPSRPEVVAQMAVTQLVCRPDDWRPSSPQFLTVDTPCPTPHSVKPWIARNTTATNFSHMPQKTTKLQKYNIKHALAGRCVRITSCTGRSEVSRSVQRTSSEASGIRRLHTSFYRRLPTFELQSNPITSNHITLHHTH